MNIFQLNQILEGLKTLQGFECSICHKQFHNPVRVKVCGHYFCSQCLNKISGPNSCPKCNMYYEQRNIESDDIMRNTHNILADLETCLQNIIHVNTPECLPEMKVLEYRNKKYKLNFFERLDGKVNKKGESSLHIACRKGKNIEVIELLKKEVDINAQDFAGWTPLHEAVESKNLETIEYLLKCGALINIPGEDYTTPLHKATFLGLIDVIKLLLQYGADREVIDIDGKKPVECTVNKDILEIYDNPTDHKNRVEQLFCIKKITPFCYYIESGYKNMLKRSKIVIEDTYDKKKVTHFIIRKTHKLSLKILVAMLDGCTIVPQEWINQFLNDDHFISIPHYTFILNNHLNKGIQDALMNKLLKLPKLFDNINFYIYGHEMDITIHNIKFSKDSIGFLITSGGGKLLHRAPSPGTCKSVAKFPFHARNTAKAAKCCNYIIDEECSPPKMRYRMPELKHKSSKWLIDCIISFTIIDDET